jgi:hypothetical protein
MMVEEIDGKEFVEAALHIRTESKIRGFKRSSCRSSKKQVGDQVTICHKLLTNMLVTSDGVQMPSKESVTLMGLVEQQTLWRMC